MSGTGMCWETCPNRHRAPCSGLSPVETRRHVARTLLWMLATGAQESLPALLEQAFDAGFDAGVVYEQNRAELVAQA